MQKLQGNPNLATKLQEKKEKLAQILELLALESKKGTPIVVEGKKDIKTLRSLGIKGIFITTKTQGKSFLDVISEIKEIKSSNVILLLDFDKRGKQWTKYLQENLEHHKIKYDLSYWHKLMALTSKEIQFIESLDVFLLNLNKNCIPKRIKLF